MISLLVENVEELNLFVIYEHSSITECNNIKLRLVITCKKRIHITIIQINYCMYIHSNREQECMQLLNPVLYPNANITSHCLLLAYIQKVVQEFWKGKWYIEILSREITTPKCYI